MKGHKLELLAPAGSFESLKAAILNGADAVYLGGGKHNARINAANFTETELAAAFDYAHERGKKVYVTLNTLMKNHELTDGLKFAEYIYKEGADAVIVQDLGLVRLIREYLPDFCIHASTQMTLANSEAVKTIEAMGVKRAVLPRELTLEEIRAISEKTTAELEVFVHGALCVCYSGQCLMSSFIGGRSGNRGLCAQPCRLPWSLSLDGREYGNSSYLISPRDLMAVELLPLLKNSGIDSLKIEGRMKSPEYVAIVTSIYRKYLDMLENEGEGNFRVEEADKEILMQAFNRGGFTRGFLEGNRNFRKLVYTKHPKHQGVLLGQVSDTRPLYVKIKLDKPLSMGDGIEIFDLSGDVISFMVTSILDKGQQVRSAKAGSEVWIGDVKTAVKKGSKVYRTLSRLLFDEARKTFEQKEIPVIPLDMEFILKTGEQARLTATDPDGDTVNIISEMSAEKAVNRALSHERIREQLGKTGGTPYYLRECSIFSDNESVIPISALNSMRRKALEGIKDQRIKKHKKPSPKEYKSFYEEWTAGKGRKKKPEKLFLSAYFYAIPDSIGDLNDYLDRAYLPLVPLNQLNKFKEEFEGEIYIWTPAILKDDELIAVKEELGILAPFIDGISYGSLGINKICKEAFPGISLCAEPSINIFNDASVEILEKLDTSTAVLSPELNLKEVKGIASQNLKLEAIVYGRIPLMTMEHCPSSLEIPCTGKCGDCSGNKGFLKDRKNEVFPFVRDTVLRRTRIFNSCVVFMDDIDAVKDTEVSIFRLAFTDEDKTAREAVARYFFEKLSGRINHEAWVIETINKIRENGYTKGHWHRGTE
ncbi:MAG: U32 family peptidase [Clostridiaceae bacterium]|nr:U32 family peptidase [Clostridiaceae bacterium]